MGKRKNEASEASNAAISYERDEVEGTDTVLPPLTDREQFAKTYFNQPYFFNSIVFQNQFTEMIPSLSAEKQNALNQTLESFFQIVHEREKNGSEGAMDFLIGCVFGSRSDRLRNVYKAWKDIRAEITRMVSVDFEIENRELSHTYDLERFTEALTDVFKWFDSETVPKMVGPYLCLVQSSGTGKTKLMYEYRKKTFEVDSEIASCLILSEDISTTKKEKGAFDFRENMRALIQGFDNRNDAANRVYEELDMFVRETLKLNALQRGEKARDEDRDEQKATKAIQAANKVVLMFDKSQSLVTRDHMYDAFLFRCVRVWLREKRNKKVIAVFAGTTSKIANFLVESDAELQPAPGSSRAVQRKNPIEYHDKGSNQLYPPFYHFATVGSCLPLLAGVTEYERAIFYGRPLFAVMANKGILDKKTPDILCRMLIALEGENWQNELIAVMNILATRVQLGETSFEIVSKLVSKAYAHLSGFSYDTRTLQLSYLPDPVCARLAMCMMDEDFRLVAPELKTTFIGKGKEWWVSKMKEIFSTGIVRPAKGDFGEVVVALYMLLCGDLLRKVRKKNLKKKKQLEYSRFSVSLDAWLELLLCGGRRSEGISDSKVSVGFIQVCRNSLRSYCNSWKSLKNELFLERMFESGVAFYVCGGCPLIDMVVPLRINRPDPTSGTRSKFRFVPLLVSIKCGLKFDQRDAESTCNAMKMKAEASELKTALCLLIVFGTDKPSLNYTGEIAIGYGAKVSDAGKTTIVYGIKVSEQLLSGEGCVVAKAILVPKDDVFKLTEAFRHMSPDSQVNGDLYSSHNFIMAHGDDTCTDLLATNAVCATSREYWKKEYTAMRKAVTTVSEVKDRKS